ncbi:putative short chain dehydrogenase/reductase [Rubrobacter xylanophilus]|uniref:Putative short chain dehydrogenase/reductase n=1 Tax=Rubrobacter xylanophilus TaxID=49319 RepID=A0A510HPC1_9ACTN|nr:mycofactocin-coupled SDR family oxidoreductase [Rubrobacter xylanophilus]BBL80587.1 putative short chain dehydrogenase/reductase [Rubrobacter xylanophilus]
MEGRRTLLLEDRVALITGAARGQGRSHALTLAREGADIIACDICEPISSAPYPMGSREELEQTARMVAELGRRVVAQKADVRSLEQLRAVVERGLSELGRIDVVCANAGVISYAPSWRITEEQWRETLETNLTGAWHTCRAVIPHMMERGEGGSIILTGSTAAVVGFENLAHYVSAKHGLVGLMKTLANELAPHRIRVNIVHPTSVDTAMIHNEATYRLFVPGADRTPTREEAARAFRTLNALPVPWVEPEDVSNAVLWLASDHSRYVTGQQLRVDAGAAEKARR